LVGLKVQCNRDLKKAQVKGPGIPNQGNFPEFKFWRRE